MNFWTWCLFSLKLARARTTRWVMNIVSLSLNFPSIRFYWKVLKSLVRLCYCTVLIYSYLITDIRYCKHGFRNIISILFKMFKNKYYLLEGIHKPWCPEIIISCICSQQRLGLKLKWLFFLFRTKAKFSFHKNFPNIFVFAKNFLLLQRDFNDDVSFFKNLQKFNVLQLFSQFPIFICTLVTIFAFFV